MIGAKFKWGNALFESRSVGCLGIVISHFVANIKYNTHGMRTDYVKSVLFLIMLTIRLDSLLNG